MNISTLAARSGVSIHRLRRYEAAGLLRAQRSDGGYRDFSDTAVREAIFLRMGRELGLSLAVLAEALPRYRAGTLRLSELEDMLHARIAQVDAEIALQRALRRKLVHHLAWCAQRRASAAVKKERGR
ncbi:MAG: MerR family DNA-binding transcriptional regulator [Burkholderiaceae bacterium]|jgi:DNA-binding transcriptional MerR regulator|nr:MerR family DNA-binding transcriptional regulator [Burkholderiaceae bacterium]